MPVTLRLSTGRIAGAESLRSDPELSNREHARRTGVSDKTVGSVRREMEAGAQIAHLDTRTAPDGKTYPASQPDRPRATAIPQANLDALNGAAEDQDGSGAGSSMGGCARPVPGHHQRGGNGRPPLRLQLPTIFPQQTVSKSGRLSNQHHHPTSRKPIAPQVTTCRHCSTCAPTRTRTETERTVSTSFPQVPAPTHSYPNHTRYLS